MASGSVSRMAATPPSSGWDTEPEEGHEAGRGGRSRSGRGRSRRPGRKGNAPGSVLLGGGALAAFGEMFVVGLTVSVLSLPLITLLPALAGGAAHYERHLGPRVGRFQDILTNTWAALRGGWVVGALTSLALLALVTNGVLALDGAVPLGRPYGYLSLALAAVVAIVGLRTAGGWSTAHEAGHAPSDTAGWRALVVRSCTELVSDPVGSLILAGSLLAVVALVWMLAPLAVIVPGMLVVAVVAVEHRATALGLREG